MLLHFLVLVRLSDIIINGSQLEEKVKTWITVLEFPIETSAPVRPCDFMAYERFSRVWPDWRNKFSPMRGCAFLP